MSLTSDYLKHVNKKKKKEDKTEAPVYVNKTAPLYASDDIAPVFVNKTAPLYLPVAPVTKATPKTTTKAQTEEKKERKWFEKGAFEDGYQFGDVIKTILGTDEDIVKNVKQGAAKMGENVIDAAVGGVGQVGKLFGADGFAENTKEFVKKDLTQMIPEVPAELRGATSTAIGTMIPQFAPLINAGKAISSLSGALNGEKDNSVLGDKSDALVQSATQFILQYGLQGVGVPWYVTAGVTSYGSNLENAYNEGATHGEAALSGLISAGGEILTEKLFGGSGLGEKGLINLAPLTMGISNKVLKVLADYGVDIAAEGFEEAFSQVVSNLGSKLYKEESLKDILLSEEAIDGYIESFVGGAFISGFANAGKAKTSIETGRDYRTGLTSNERKVADYEYQNRLAEEEKNGKVTNRRKNAIYEEVVRDMERGRISTDTIEEVLGGEEYSAYKGEYDAFFGGETLKAYKDTVANEDAQIKQIEEQMKALENEPDTIDKYNALESQIEGIKNSAKRNELKAQLESEAARISEIRNQLRTNVSEMVKGDRLYESYNELIRSEQTFVPDFDKFKGSKYEDVAKRTLESAVAAGVKNNSQAHDIFDLAAKTSSDTGIAFVFKRGEQIKADFIKRQTELIAKLEKVENPTEEQTAKLEKLKDTLAKVQSGEINVNGDITADGIVLNLDAEKPLNRVVGHEVMHSLEKHGLYKDAYNALIKFSKTKREYQTRYDALVKLYEGIEGADVDAELAADLVGDYLFSDENFVKHLSVTNRNVFQKIYDEIKYLYKVATAGSKEARELERVKKIFERVYREGGKAQTETKTKTKYSLTGRTTPAYKELTSKDPIRIVDVKSGIETGSYADMRDAAKKTATNEGWFDKPHYNADTDSLIFITDESFSHAYSNLSSDFGEDTIRCMAHIPEIIQNAVLVHVEDPKNPNKQETKVYTFFGAIDSVGGVEPVKLIVKEYDFKSENAVKKNIRKYFEENGIMEQYDTLYDAKALEVIGIEGVKKEPDASGKVNEQGSQAHATSGSTIRVADLLNLVKGDAEKYIPKKQFSLSDSDGKQLTTDADIRYSLSDSKGREISPAVQNRFGKSKVTDENGNLKPVYHGTATGEFSIFDKSKGSVEGDYGSGFYFTDNDADVSEHYEGGGPDFDNKVARLAEQIEAEEDIDYEEAEQKAREQLYKGSHKFEVYLNIENPAIVGKTMLFAPEDYFDQYNEEDYDNYEDYEADVEQLFSDDIDNIIWDIERNVDIYSTDGISGVLWEAMSEGGIGLEELKAKLNNLYLEDSNGNFVGNEVARQIVESLGYDGIIDPTVSGKWNMDIEEGTTHYIVFKPNQIKAVTNENPTDNPDIHRSLSRKGEQSFVPVNRSEVYGKDIALETAAPVQTAPVKSEARNTQTVEQMLPDDLAPKETEAEPQRVTYQDTQQKVTDKISNLQTELTKNERLREQSAADFDAEIANLQAKYDALNNKNTIKANDFLRRIERKQRIKNDVDSSYAKRIQNLGERIEKMSSPTYRTAEQRRAKQQEYTEMMKNLIGDTTTWVDKKLGISYKVNTLRRNLRDVVRKADGSRDIEKADAIYDELQGKYNHNEAVLNREAAQIKKPYADMKITKAEDAYIQMLGELRHNPDTELTLDEVNEFYEKHKNSIDAAKVDKIIDMARKTYDDLLSRVNEVLREQGMKEIPYRKGYFPHFTEEKQSFIAKLFNWKTRNNDIPTDIAGLTENFNPNRSWQSFNKERKGDTTDYSFTKGMDTYVQGSLDWVHHIEDIQKRRAFENYIRYVHSEQGVKERIDAIKQSEEYDADEMQDQIDLVFAEARNPLNNFVVDLRAGTNTLANKKSSMDRGMEDATNRKFYSTMTNISNRVSANMVGGSISSALTNFIPITQSWSQVSPISSLRAMGDTIRSTFRDDGTIEKSDFLTNRLRKADNLHKTGWDKVSDAAGFLMEGIDNFTSQTVWRSKYLENISKGMSESEAIKNADQFAENVLAGRSRGNQPTLFDAKNPITKMLTAFQLEVNNQYGYMFKDMPQDMRNEAKGKLVIGYASMFLGAYAYNSLYSALTGRDSAFDPIGIIEDLLRDMGLIGDNDEEEEEIAPTDVVMNFAENIMQEVPFVGGLMGGGRVPINSALPYDGNVMDILEGGSKLLFEKDMSDLTSEWLKPVYYVGLPVGGGQLKKTVEGLSMFSEDHPISGSYTKSGDLRFPVDDTIGNRVKAGLFGQWSNKNARDYFDNNRAPLKEKQIQEFIDVDIPIRDYWEYREGLSGLSKLKEKADYIAGLDLPIDKKNLLINNIADRKEPIDLTGYEDFSGFEEFDFAVNNPEKYEIAKKVGGYEAYMKYQKGMKDMKLEEKVDYVAGLNLTTAQKNALINGETDRKEPIDLTGYENYSSLDELDFATKNPERYGIAKALGGYDTYIGYMDVIGNIDAKDKNGNTVRGLKKERVYNYIFNELDIDYGAKCVLFKSQGFSVDDDMCNEIVDYINGCEDLSFEERVAVLRKLDFEVTDDGDIYW